MSYLERAVEISTEPENCEGDNWTDLINLCGEADREIKCILTLVANGTSTKECRKDCDVYKKWLKDGERITELEAELAKCKGKG